MLIKAEINPIFPVVFQSSAGWVKEAISEDDLTECTKDEVFDEWIGGEILDSVGIIHRVTSAKFFRPNGGISAVLAYLVERFQNGRYLELETMVDPPVDFQTFKLKLKKMYPELEGEIEYSVNPEEAIRLLQ